MFATQRPLAAFAFTEAATVRGWDTTPTWYLVSTEDNSIPPKLQEFMAARMKAHTESIEASHTSFVAQPQAVALFIQNAVADFTSRSAA